MVRVSRVEFHGYADCIRLENANARVTLGHHCGGRVLEYSWQGVNLLALDPNQAGWTFEPGGPEIDPWGGRFRHWAREGHRASSRALARALVGGGR